MVCFLFWFSVAADENPLLWEKVPAYELQWSVSPPTPIQVGDRLVLKIQSLKGESQELETVFPAGSPKQEDLGVEISLKASPEGILVLAIPVRGGPITLPAFGVRVQGSKDFLARTQPFNVGEVQPVQPLREQPLAYYPPAELEMPIWLKALAVGAGLAVMILVGFLLRAWWRSRAEKKPEIEPTPVPALSPLQRALQELQELERQRLWEKGYFKRHYFGISDILKIYVGAMYRFDALESTTTEMMSLAEKMGMDSRTLERLQKLFEGLDLVKFTDHVPTASEPTKWLQEAKGFITMVQSNEEPRLSIASATEASGVKSP